VGLILAVEQGDQLLDGALVLGEVYLIGVYKHHQTDNNSMSMGERPSLVMA
jgi:hypothetical protein